MTLWIKLVESAAAAIHVACDAQTPPDQVIELLRDAQNYLESAIATLEAELR
jgi:hypothetical protein